jgi:hypothetical protein
VERNLKKAREKRINRFESKIFQNRRDRNEIKT